MQLSERDIIENCKKGKQDAFEYIYKKYASKLMAVAMRYSATTFEAEDILQESFIKAFQNIGKFTHQGSFEGWLKRIVVHESINLYHKNVNLRFNEIAEDLPLEDDSFKKIISGIHWMELNKIMMEMPEGYRIIFNMSIIEEYTHKEIAEILKISEGTSKSQLSKARVFLKNLLIKHNCVIHV